MATIINDKDKKLQAATVRLPAVASNYIYFSNPAPVFQLSGGVTSPLNYVITATFAGQITGTVTWSVVSGTISSTAGQSGNTWTIAGSELTTRSAVVRATLVYLGTTYTKDFTISKVADGASSVNVVLSTETFTFTASPTGNIPSYAGSGTTIRVYEGATELVYDGVGTANGSWTVSSTATGITRGAITDSGTYATVANHSGMADATDTATITYTITGKTSSGSSFTVTKNQNFSKSKTGSAGTSPVIYEIVTSAPVITKQSEDAATPGTHSSITIQGTKYEGITTTNYGWITITPNGGTEALVATDTATTPITLAPANSDGKTSYTIKMYNQPTVDVNNLIDTQVINIIFKGTTGVNGVTTTLTNESHTFPSTTDGTVNTYNDSGTDIRVYEGSTELSYDGVGTTNSSWKIATTATNITVGTISAITSVDTITAIVTNQSHILPADTSGVVSSYTNSGTEIRVYQGGLELNYDGLGVTNGTWTITTSATNITRGTITDSGPYATIGAHSGVATAIDTASITYTITGIDTKGTSFSLVRTQTFTKSKTATNATTPLYYAITTSAPVITKQTTDAITPGVHTSITIQGKKYEGVTTTNYGWVTITPNAGIEATTATDTSTSAVTLAPANTDGKVSYTIRLYNQATVAGATLLDTQVVYVLNNVFFARVAAQSGVAAGIDTSSIVYTITGKNKLGTAITATKTQTFTKSKAGSDAITIGLVYSASVLTTATDGTGYTLPTGNSIKLDKGGLPLAVGVTYGPATTVKNGLTATVNTSTGAITLTGASNSWISDTESFLFTAVYSGTTYSVGYTISKSKTGATGATGGTGPTGLSNITAYKLQVQTTTTAPTYTSPTTGATAPTGWTLTVPTPSVGQVLWYIDGRYNSSSITIGGVAAGQTAWSAPIAISVFQDIKSDNWNGGTGGTGGAPTYGNSATYGTAGYYLSKTTGTIYLNNAVFRGDINTAGQGIFSGQNLSSFSIPITGVSYTVYYSAFGQTPATATVLDKVTAGLLGYAGSLGSAYNVGVMGKAENNGIGIVGDGKTGGYFSSSVTGGNALEVTAYSGTEPAIRINQGTVIWGTYTVPAPTGSTTKFLRNDGTWSAVPSTAGGTVTSVSGTGTVAGLTLSGTVTDSGNLTLSGSLAVKANGNTGTATAVSSTLSILGSTSTGVTGAYVGTSAAGSTVTLNVQTTSPSDLRLKQDIQDVDLGLGFVNQLRPVSYKLIADPKQQKGYGFIAQEVEQIIGNQSSLVYFEPDWKVGEETGFNTIHYPSYIAILTKAIQELSAKVDSLQTQIDTLRNSQP